MQPETIIFSNHTLDTSHIEKLANQLAYTLKFNIEFNEYISGETIQNTIGGNLENDVVAYLSSNLLGKSKYVLEVGEATLLISSEIISYDLPLHTSLDSFNHLQLNETFSMIINELKALGATEIIIAEDSITARELNQSELTFNEFKKAITKNSKYFKL
ncbi:hypothetical protein V3Q90_06315 [Flavobacterium oreochromis]|uniref:hypothetical protein n=1 Tax=Flavobacterium oreochromis TaxID=2906078 RepID=UPI00385F99A2